MIEVFGSHVRDVRQAAARANLQARYAQQGGGDGLTNLERRFGNLHGLRPEEVLHLRDRFEQHVPGVATRFGTRSRADRFFDGVLPQGATLDPNAGAGLAASLRKHAGLRRQGAGGLPGGANLEGGLYQTSQRPYQPEVDSPDRASYPIHRNLANIYWRIFYKLDAIIGTCIDLLSEMPWSNYTLTGVDGEVKDAYEHMLEEIQFRAIMPYMTREFHVIGEVAPHLFWSDELSLWTHVALHNPDQLEVIHAPFLRMDPLVEFRPDDRLRQVLSSSNPMLASVRETIPEEVLGALTSGRNIPLSPINCTFIARKLHPYDVRGTSIISRMWRTLMYEDSLFAASLAIARRSACFVAGTPVLTTTGLKPIEDVRIGDRVIAGNGRVETVENAWAEKPDGEGLVEINALGTQPLFCTPSHRFKVWAAPRNCACGCGTPLSPQSASGRSKRTAFVTGHHLRLLRDTKTGQMRGGADVGWKVYSTEPKVRAPEDYEPIQKLEARDIRAGDYLVIPRTFSAVETATRPEEARLLGYYLAEGSSRNVTQGQGDDRELRCEGVMFTFSLAESETWARDVVLCASVLGLNATHYRHVPGELTQTSRSGRVGRTNVYLQKQKDEHFAHWLRTHGGEGRQLHRTLSEEAMRWPLELKREVVRGYFRGDGHLGFPGDCPQVTAASTSRTLIYQMRLILAQLGIFGSISYSPKGTKPGEENWNDCWVISSTGRDARALAAIVWGVELGAPSREGRGSKSGGGARTWFDDEYVYVPVQHVERHDDDVTTYNLSVSGDASYIAEGVQTFNSPLKVAKLGDQNTGWIPTPEQEARLLELLAASEVDPAAWLVWNYGVQFELVGAQERAWKVEQSAEFIERQKLIALGISKAFLHGEVTYACLPYDSPCDTPDGSVSIQTLRPGDKVLDAHGAEQTVVHAWNEGTPPELIEIELFGGTTIRATPNHRWPAFVWPRTCVCGCGQPLTRAGQTVRHGHGLVAQNMGVTYQTIDHGRALPSDYEPMQKIASENLRVGDCLLVPRKFSVREEAGVTPAHARLLGYYMAEGCTFSDNGDRTKQQACFTLGRHEETTLAEDIKRCCAGLVGDVSTWVCYPSGPDGSQLQVRTAREGGWQLGNWLLEHGGHYSQTKEVAPAVMRWPLEWKRELVRGAFLGDGSQVLITREYKGKISGPYLQVSYTTASKSWAEQLWRILVQLGIWTRIQKRERTDKRAGWPAQSVCWEVNCQSDAAVALADLVWGAASKGRQIERARDVRATVRFDENYAYVPIRSVRTVANKSAVYNIEVTGSHTYLTQGVATHNSAASGLSVFLQRLKAMREFFEAVWIYPRLLRPVAEMNMWIRPTEAELSHRVRTKRSQREVAERNRYLVPKIEWDRPLDPSIDSAMIQAFQALQGLGARFSKTTMSALVNRDYETELRQIVHESKMEQDLLAKHPELGGALGGGGDGGGGGGGIAPPLPPSSLGLDEPMDGAPPMPDEGGGGGPPPEAASGDGDEPHGGTRGDPDWTSDVVRDLVAVFEGDAPEEEPWSRMVDEWTQAAKDRDPTATAALRALKSGDATETWAAIEEWLLMGGYPPRVIHALEDVLARKGILQSQMRDAELRAHGLPDMPL